MRKSGIDIIGDIPWGTYLCLFYQTGKDLIDILVPYFKAGLKGNEFCLWITAEPLNAEDVKKAVRKSVPNLDEYLEKGQIEITPYNEWYFKDGSLDLAGATQGWKGRLNRALADGYAGMRVTSDTAWVRKDEWPIYTRYLSGRQNTGGKGRMLFLGACPLDKCGAPEIIDMVNNHQFALIRRSGKWDAIGSYQYNWRRYALEKSFKELQCLYDIARITGDPDLTLKEQLATIVHLLPRALYYPKIAFASITMKNQQFRTGNYIDTSRKISADILVQGARAGSVEVGYTKAPPAADNNLLSKQERLLLDAVAERLGAVTEQKQYQELLNTIYCRAPLGIYIMQDDKLQYTNPQFQKITGYSQPELLGRELFSLIAVEDSDVVRSSNIYSLEEENPYPCEYRILNKTGQIKWVMQTVSPIHYQGKEATLGSVMDITERKYLERKVIEYEELSKMKSDLLSTVSHELRTPLATIKGYSTMILDYYARLSSDETKDYLRSIDSSTDRLSKLVDNLLDTSRMEAGLLRLKKAPTNISQLIKAAASEARIRASHHHIMATTSQKLPIINVDAKRIRQVVDNLIDNAFKYSPPGTDVLISARKAGRELLISVTDQGSGIPAGELTNIFDRMYRIEQRQYSGMDGIGLGLYICQRLVESHGGRIWAESTLGKGSTINLTLPIERPVKEIKPLTRSVLPKVYLS